MASINRKVKQSPILTHEGAKAVRISDMKELRRSVLSCMLWENEFYEDDEEISKRIVNLIQGMPKNKLDEVAELAFEARDKQHLRHVPLLIINALASVHYSVAETITKVIQRPDELCELLSIYWKDGKKPIAKQIKKGLGEAFKRFNEYSLQKYNQDREIKLRDVMFLTHPKPNNDEQAVLWKRLANNELATPLTWEVELSASKDKKSSWEMLIKENKLGGLATLRNLRNMQEANVEKSLIKQAVKQTNYSKVLPFRFIAADRYAPQYESEIEEMLLSKLSVGSKLSGSTILLVDVSGSMDTALSEKSDMLRIDAGVGLAMILRELCDDIRIFTFSDKLVEIPGRRGFALRDAMINSQPHSSTQLGAAVGAVMACKPDRLVVISDEQSHDDVPCPNGKAYMLNVASNKNGVGYGKWVHVDGFSEAVVDYIIESENQS